ncbi:unnamed protein product [Auanema sp. JU1783]|nr:unnamed protein product [Auanema sp. JU1783]
MLSRTLSRSTRFLHCSTCCCSAEQPSTSFDSTLSYVDGVKTQYGSELEILNGKLATAQEERKKLVMPDSREFSALMSTSVISEKCSLVPVGSTVNGLYCGGSDLDFVFVPHAAHRTLFLRAFHKSLGFRNQFLFSLLKLLEREVKQLDVTVTKSTIVSKGRVPLLSVNLSNSIKLDIQFSDENFHAIRNTHLIRMYSNCDERFIQLYIWLRTLALKFQILNSKVGALASYHLVLLIVHFLQSEKCLTPWPVLPVLGLTHPQVVGKNIDIDHIIHFSKSTDNPIAWKSHNKMTISELIVRFVDYYSSFRASDSAIYIDTGRVLRRKHVSDPNCLQLFDPYSRQSVCRSPFASFAFVEAMHYVRKHFKKGDMITSFPEYAEEAQSFLSETKWKHWRVHMEEMKKIL